MPIRLGSLMNPIEPPKMLMTNDTTYSSITPIVAPMTILRKPGRHLDDPGAVQREHHDEDGERGAGRLQHDPVLRVLVETRDRTDGVAVAERVHGAEELGPPRLEVGGHHSGEADDDADQDPRSRLEVAFHVGGRGEPADRRRDEEDHEQHDRGGDDTVDRHHFGLIPAARTVVHRTVERAVRRAAGILGAWDVDVAVALWRSPTVRVVLHLLFVEKWVRHGRYRISALS